MLFPIVILSLFGCGNAVPAQRLGLPNTPVFVGELPAIVNESSGIIKSRLYPDKNVFWTHNDSGDSARIFAIDGTGKLLREVAIPGAKNKDWEEISIDQKGRLIICDIGDKHKKRRSIHLYRIREPDAFNVNEAALNVESFQFTYPEREGPVNAEGLFVREGNAFLFTKEGNGTRCYQLRLPEVQPETVVEAKATCVATSNTINTVTGAAISNDGCHVALLNYSQVVVFDLALPFEQLPEGAQQMFSLPRHTHFIKIGKSEGICWDNKDLVITTEGSAIYRILDALSDSGRSK